ncbi:hypothetical protein BD410DRAFT_505033 [Rickenella mellea]|uniref:Uncharacterized protein n=1 Tax=Rickenella mellea TaxID=50990 RepID=A0A4Y7PS75_9AGAM|nr:hypothetical protein BD410DRAFT_505033 [Rickenella mellea]
MVYLIQVDKFFEKIRRINAFNVQPLEVLRKLIWKVHGHCLTIRSRAERTESTSWNDWATVLTRTFSVLPRVPIHFKVIRQPYLLNSIPPGASLSLIRTMYLSQSTLRHSFSTFTFAVFSCKPFVIKAFRKVTASPPPFAGSRFIPSN